MFPIVFERELADKSKFVACQQYATLPKLEAYFQSPKILGRPTPKWSVLEVEEAIVVEKLYAWSRGRPAENFALLDKMPNFCQSQISL